MKLATLLDGEIQLASLELECQCCGCHYNALWEVDLKITWSVPRRICIECQVFYEHLVALDECTGHAKHIHSSSRGRKGIYTPEVMPDIPSQIPNTLRERCNLCTVRKGCSYSHQRHWENIPRNCLLSSSKLLDVLASS